VTRDISKTKDYRYLFVPGKKVYAKIPLYLYSYESARGTSYLLTHDGSNVHGSTYYKCLHAVSKGQELHIERVLKKVDIGGDSDSIVGYILVNGQKTPFSVHTGYGDDPGFHVYFEVK
jgi:hypothetical protein